VGYLFFGTGIALLSWLLDVFGENRTDSTTAFALGLIAALLFLAYFFHARNAQYPLLRLALFKVRTFRVAVLGGFITRLGIGGMPFLLPLLYQLGLGMSAWQTGLLLMPAAAAAMFMKYLAPRILAHFGYRKVLILNTLLMGLTISLFGLVTVETPIGIIMGLGLAQGFFNSLQFTSMNSMAYSDIDASDFSMASTISSSFQQLSMSFGLALGALLSAWYLGDAAQTDPIAVAGALHYAFLTLATVTVFSSLSFWSLRPNDGSAVSRTVRKSH
jgi:MFS family permease